MKYLEIYEVNEHEKKLLTRVEIHNDAAEIECLPQQYDADIESKIYEVLKLLRCPQHTSGYKYIMSAIHRLIEIELNCDVHIMKDIYYFVADDCGSTVSRVERSIRYTKFAILNEAPAHVLESIYGHVPETLTNSALIIGIAEYIRR